MGEREWKDAAAHREPKWPLAGYAPGEYMGSCTRCGHHFLNMDKRAAHCLPCAIDAANESLEAYRLANRKLRDENDALKATIQIVRSLPDRSKEERG